MEKNQSGNLTKKISFITKIKVTVPILIIIFIICIFVLKNSSYKQGSVVLLTDRKYLPSLISDIAHSKYRIICGMYMYKINRRTINNLEQPTSLISAALIKAASRGVDVEIVFDIDNTEDEINSNYNKLTAEYLKSKGIKTRFDSPYKKLHAKMCVIDDNITYLGSHNYTFSAMEKNSEVSARIISSSVAKDAIKYLENL